MTLVAAADLLGSRAAREEDAPAAGADLLGDMTDLRIGDVVVHEDHGIAKIVGLESMPGAVGAGVAVVLEHAAAARRLVPVEEADRLWRYGADADAVTLDKLDGSSWEKRRAAINAAVAESATELTRIAAERSRLTAPVFQPDVTLFERFAADFAFTETADQMRAINAVRTDLASGRPMDRLVIGDVGYGKTEVALRAAAIVALAGGQVAVAAPTTVLVRQHLEVFRRRFEGTGIVVEGLSRLSTPAEKKAVKAGLADGSIRVVVGTGAVAGKGVAYQALGLVVIDEEQRFGAADKAKLRGDASTHVLTLSATPIPRTLQAAMIGLQQLSIIATPPARRQPIRTTVNSFDDARVRISPAPGKEPRRPELRGGTTDRGSRRAGETARPAGAGTEDRAGTRQDAGGETGRDHGPLRRWDRRCPAGHQHHRGGAGRATREHDDRVACGPLRLGAAPTSCAGASGGAAGRVRSS